MPDVIQAVAAPDHSMAATVGSWVFDVLDAVHHYFAAHHAVIARLIRTRGADDPHARAVVADAAEDRSAVDALVAECMGAALRWQATARAVDRVDLLAGLVRLVPTLEVALDRIEREVSPLADRYVDDRLATVVADYPFRALGGRRGRGLLGAVLEADAPEGIAAPGALGAEPGPIASVRRVRARREYRRRIAALPATGTSGDVP